MPAYVVVIREETTDPEELKIYSQKAPESLAGHPATFRALYGASEVIEGPDVEGVAILEFPSFESAKAWYYSPAYQEVVQHRLKSGRFRGIIVQGIEDHTEKEKGLERNVE
jgi:uncharacterized protein (DUF1330 family)